MSTYQLDILSQKGISIVLERDLVANYIKLLIKIVIVSHCFAGVSVKAIDQTDVLKRDFNTMMSWIEGEFDNIEQVYFNGVLDVDEAIRHDRLHSNIRRVPVPSLGDAIFYVEQYRNNDPANVVFRRLYSFSMDMDRLLIVQTIYDFTDEANIPSSPESFGALNLSELKALPDGCAIFWRKRANQFVATMEKGACPAQVNASDADATIEGEFILAEDEMWIDSHAVDSEGNILFGNDTGVPYKFLKQQTFTCWVFARDEASEEGGIFKNGLQISDQGGEIWVPLSEEGKKVGIKMRNVHWPYGNNRNSLVLYAHNDDSGRAVSYAWTEPDGDRIALNLRWIQASCTKNN